MALRAKGFGFLAATRDDDALPSSPSSEASGVVTELMVEADKSLDNTSLTMPFRTPFFAISFLRSVLAPSETWGPVNNVTTELLAQSLTLASGSSRHSTSWGRYGRMGNVRYSRRSSTRARMVCSRTRATLLLNPWSLTCFSTRAKGVSCPLVTSLILDPTDGGLD